MTGSLSLCGAVHCELPWEVLKSLLGLPPSLPPGREGGAARGAGWEGRGGRGGILGVQRESPRAG